MINIAHTSHYKLRYHLKHSRSITKTVNNSMLHMFITRNGVGGIGEYA